MSGTSAKDVAARMVAQRGPLPHHVIQSVAQRMTKALADHPQAERKPA